MALEPLIVTRNRIQFDQKPKFFVFQRINTENIIKISNNECSIIISVNLIECTKSKILFLQKKKYSLLILNSACHMTNTSHLFNKLYEKYLSLHTSESIHHLHLMIDMILYV